MNYNECSNVIKKMFNKTRHKIKCFKSSQLFTMLIFLVLLLDFGYCSRTPLHKNRTKGSERDSDISENYSKKSHSENSPSNNFNKNSFKSSDIDGGARKNDRSGKDIFKKLSSYPLLSFGKVLNFFPVGGGECAGEVGGAGSRAGKCLNVYECHQRQGTASGDCAMGLGVCCIFTVTCGGVAANNLTYFPSPGYPELWSGAQPPCELRVRPEHAGVTQIRIDFLHFNIGQPNRSTGACDGDVLTIGEGSKELRICGQNHGQHAYIDMQGAHVGAGESAAGRAEAAEDEGLLLRLLSPRSAPRLWLLRITQLTLAQAAPPDCLQYFTEYNGTFQTWNFAENGRHLSPMRYRACVRRATGACSLAYSACDARSFRIGPADDPQQHLTAEPGLLYGGGPGAYGGPGTGFYGPQGAFVPDAALSSQAPPTQAPPSQAPLTQESAEPGAEDPPLEAAPEPVSDPIVADGSEVVEDEIEGSGDDVPPANMQPSRGRQFTRWSPYAQFFSGAEPSLMNWRYWGYGNYGHGLFGYGRQRCVDRITIPCDNDELIAGGVYGAGVCDPHHCGASLCPGLDNNAGACRVETSRTPFAVNVNFGPAVAKNNPEDNIGACLNYEQIPCA